MKYVKKIIRLLDFKINIISALLAFLSRGEWNGRDARPALKRRRFKPSLPTRTGKQQGSFTEIGYKVFSCQPKITKSLLIFLFIASFFIVQGEACLLGVGRLPVVAQTPAEVTNTQPAVNPDALVEEAKKLYQAQKFPEAITLLQQAAIAFVARKDVLNQAMTLDLQGQVNLAQGQPEMAVENFSAAVALYDQSRNKIEAIRSGINQAQALRKAGFYRRALDLLEELNKNLPKEIDPQLKAIALRSLGITQRLVGDLNKAETSIKQSLESAESNDSPKREENISAAYLMLGNIAKDRGNVAKQRNEITTAEIQFQAAIDHYKKAAETTQIPTTKIEAQLNELSVWGDRELPFTDAERETLRQVRETIDTLPLSRTAVHARINWARMVMEPKNEANVNPQDIAQQLTIALEQARKLKDTRSESYALGQLGELRKNIGDLEQARVNTQQALAIAQSIGASDIAYRWQWQLAQILKEQGKTEGAIASYGTALKNLESIRGDLVSLNPDAQFSFRESVEPVYREFAGLLLQSKNPENLAKARTAIESLQQAELVNFFRENCITSKSVKIDDIDKKAAVIYPIVLADRLEVILSLPGDRFESHSIAKPRVEVQEIFTRLRQAITPSLLDSRTANPTLIPKDKQDGQYLKLAQQVYDWLIRPFKEDIEASEVKTLVFVLDGPMLNLPMSVLHDGEKYLVENYAIALTPGLQLLDSQPLARGEITALKAGLSEERKLPLASRPEPLYFPALPNVKYELNGIQSEVSGKLILNNEFTTDAIQRAINSVPYPIVHLATHGMFSSNAEETFILTSDDRLNINQLKQLLRGREEDSRKAIELLVLSACETATGDEQAALGLAGVAVQAGARSTLATLWVVNDEATAKLMIRFYEELKNTEVSKAKALQQAQLWLMQQDSKYKNPDYWAPFVLVGNWL
ncbi:MAG TPA: CHAT domain-containing protein [Stenomitos sp.]